MKASVVPASVAREDAARSAVAGPGRMLEPGERARMERGFGMDFASVRIHEDAGAALGTAQLGALAVARGEHVAVMPGARDDRTLAHELAHVVQHRRAQAGEASPGVHAEAEAHAAADAVAGGGLASPVAAAPAGAFQCLTPIDPAKVAELLVTYMRGPLGGDAANVTYNYFIYVADYWRARGEVGGPIPPGFYDEAGLPHLFGPADAARATTDLPAIRDMAELRLADQAYTNDPGRGSHMDGVKAAIARVRADPAAGTAIPRPSIDAPHPLARTGAGNRTLTLRPEFAGRGRTLRLQPPASPIDMSAARPGQTLSLSPALTGGAALADTAPGGMGLADTLPGNARKTLPLGPQATLARTAPQQPGVPPIDMGAARRGQTLPPGSALADTAPGGAMLAAPPGSAPRGPTASGAGAALADTQPGGAAALADTHPGSGSAAPAPVAAAPRPGGVMTLRAPKVTELLRMSHTARLARGAGAIPRYDYFGYTADWWAAIGQEGSVPPPGFVDRAGRTHLFSLAGTSAAVRERMPRIANMDELRRAREIYDSLPAAEDVPAGRGARGMVGTRANEMGRIEVALERAQVDTKAGVRHVPKAMPQPTPKPAGTPAGPPIADPNAATLPDVDPHGATQPEIDPLGATQPGGAGPASAAAPSRPGLLDRARSWGQDVRQGLTTGSKLSRAGFFAGGVSIGLGIIGGVVQTSKTAQFLGNMRRDIRTLNEGDTWVDPGRYHPDLTSSDHVKRTLAIGKEGRVHKREDGNVEIHWSDGSPPTIVRPAQGPSVDYLPDPRDPNAT